jgi:hypothetical protein
MLPPGLVGRHRLGNENVGSESAHVDTDCKTSAKKYVFFFATFEVSIGMRLSLPYPPSINHYWRRAGRFIHISREGREYRKQVCELLAADDQNPISLDAR